MTTISDLYHASVRESRRQSYPSWDREASVETSILDALRTLAPETPRHAFLRRLAMKLVREWHSPKLDNLIDIVGYTECQFSQFRSLYEPLVAPDPTTLKPDESAEWAQRRCEDIVKKHMDHAYTSIETKPPVPVDPTLPTFPDTDLGRFDEMLHIIKTTSLRSFDIGKYNEQRMFFFKDDVGVQEDGSYFTNGSQRFSLDDLINCCRDGRLTIDITELRRCKQELDTFNTWLRTPSTVDRKIHFVSVNFNRHYVHYVSAADSSKEDSVELRDIPTLLFNLRGSIQYDPTKLPVPTTEPTDPVEAGLAAFWDASTSWILPTAWIYLSPEVGIRLINPDLVRVHKHGWPPSDETRGSFNTRIRNMGLVIDRTMLPTP
jgi:hypothetical protein